MIPYLNISFKLSTLLTKNLNQLIRLKIVHATFTFLIFCGGWIDKSLIEE